MKHPKSLKVVFAALAVSMVPLFGSCDSGADLETERAMEELEQIKSSFKIKSIDWRLPDELLEKFTLRLIWVWEKDWLEGDEPTLDNIHSEQLGRRFDAEEIVKNGRCSSGQVLRMDNRNNDLPGTPLRLIVQFPNSSNDGSWGYSFMTSNDRNTAIQSGTFHVPYPDGRLISWGVNGGILQLGFVFDEGHTVGCRLEFEIVEGGLDHPDED